MFGNWAFNSFTKRYLYCWKAGVGAEGSLESKTALKICWKSFFKYQATDNEAKTTGGATTAMRINRYDMAGVLLSSVGVALVSLSLLPRRKSWRRVRQAENQAIEQDKKFW